MAWEKLEVLAAPSLEQYRTCCTVIGALADLCFSIPSPDAAVAGFLETSGQKAEDLQTHLQVWGADLGWSSWSSQEKLSFEDSVLRKSFVNALGFLRREAIAVALMVVHLASPSIL